MSRIIACLIVAAALGLPAGALAQPRDKPYETPPALRAQCEGEIAKDTRWNAELRISYEPGLHQAEDVRIQQNKRHVFLAYGAIWVLTVVFLALQWMRQQKLKAELARLEEQLGKAAAS